MTDADRVIDLSVEVPGTPDEVWAAIATGPGISSWFVPHEVAEHEGGAVRMSFGPLGEDVAEVAAWDPPRRVVFTGGGERPLAYEWLVEARDGGTCVVRLVNSGFGPGSDWDADYDGMSQGWRIFLANLRLYLTHFRGRPARAAVPAGMVGGPGPAAFETLCSTLGVRADLQPGDSFTLSGDGVPALAGTVVEAQRKPAASFVLLLLDGPVAGTGFLAAEGEGEHVAVSGYVYLHGPDADAVAQRWTAFFTERFPMPQPAPAQG